MSTIFSIFPQSTNKVGSLKFSAPRMYNQNNANACTLIFSSNEHRNEQFFSPREVSQDIVVFYLSNTDAEILSTVGMLDDDYRADLVQILRRFLSEQENQSKLE